MNEITSLSGLTFNLSQGDDAIDLQNVETNDNFFRILENISIDFSDKENIQSTSDEGNQEIAFQLNETSDTEKKLNVEQETLEQQVAFFPNMNLPMIQVPDTIENTNLKYSLAVNQDDQANGTVSINLSTDLLSQTDNEDGKISISQQQSDQTTIDSDSSEQIQSDQTVANANLFKQIAVNDTNNEKNLDPFNESSFVSSKNAAETIISQNPTATNLEQIKVVEAQQQSDQAIQSVGQFKLVDQQINSTSQTMPNEQLAEMIEREFNLETTENFQQFTNKNEQTENELETLQPQQAKTVITDANNAAEKLLVNKSTLPDMKSFDYLPAIDNSDYSTVNYSTETPSSNLPIQNNLADPSALIQPSLQQIEMTTTDAATSMNSDVNTHFDEDGWQDDMSGQIHWLANQKVSSAQINIHPRELGPVHAQINLTDNKIEIMLSSQHEQVREALEQSLPKLQALFENSDIDLGNVNVSDQASYQQHDSSAQQQQAHSQSRNHYQTGPEEMTLQATTNIKTSNKSESGLIDYYA